MLWVLLVLTMAGVDHSWKNNAMILKCSACPTTFSHEECFEQEAFILRTETPVHQFQYLQMFCQQRIVRAVCNEMGQLMAYQFEFYMLNQSTKSNMRPASLNQCKWKATDKSRVQRSNGVEDTIISVLYTGSVPIMTSALNLNSGTPV